MERLDKVLGNEDWIKLFPKSSIIHLPKTHFDHNPILVELIPKNNVLYKPPFRLETYWCKHPSFKTLVQENWSNNDYNRASNLFI